MDEHSKTVIRTVIGAAILSVAGNVLQTYTQLQVMEQKLLGVQDTQNLKVEKLEQQDRHMVNRLDAFDRKLGKFETMFYTHSQDGDRHYGRGK
jgi:hypothetical protein